MKVEYVFGLLTGLLISVIVFSFLFKRWNSQKEMIVQNHNQFLHVIENTKDFIYYYRLFPERKYLYLSPSAEYFFGEGSIEFAYKEPDVPIRDVHPDDYNILMKKLNGEVDFSQSIIQRWKDKDGKYRWFEEYATPIYEYGRLVALKGVLRNIDEKIELQQELQYRITHDSLTELYNRSYFEQKMAEFNEQKEASVAIILCDLDELKYVNDNFGHHEGDMLIKITARLLNQFGSDNVTVARIGGDEFVLVVANIREKEAKELVQSIQKCIENYIVDGLKREIKLSIGFSFTSDSIGNMTELFIKADRNMYEIKSKRKQEQTMVLNENR